MRTAGRTSDARHREWREPTCSACTTYPPVAEPRRGHRLGRRDRGGLRCATAYDVATVRAAEQVLLDDAARRDADAARAASGLARVCAELLDGVYGARVLLLVGSGNNGGDALYAGAPAGRPRRAGRRAAALRPGARGRPGGAAAGRRPGRRRRAATRTGPGRRRHPRHRRPRRTARPSGRASSAGCPRTHWWSRSTCPAASTRRPARSTASRSAPTSPSPSVRSRSGCSSTPAPSTRASSSWSTSASTCRRPPSRCCRPTTSAALLPRPDARVGQVPPRRRRRGRRLGRSTPVLRSCAPAARVRGGAGMVRYVGDDEPAALVRARWPEVVVGEGRVQAWTVGSGGGGDAAARLERAVADGVPLVVDADALDALRRPPGSTPAPPLLLTPHAGELARLVGADRADVEARRLHHAPAAARDLDAVVLLKGSTTVVARPDGLVRVNPTGTPALATAGSGDVLAGLCGALLAGGLDPFDAGSVAAWLHGLAGRLAAEGGRPVSAADVLGALPGRGWQTGPDELPVPPRPVSRGTRRPGSTSARSAPTSRRCGRGRPPRCWPWSRPTATATAWCPRARAAVAGGATWLGTALLDEALALRAAGITAPRVLAWLLGPGERCADAVARRHRPVGQRDLGARRGGRRGRRGRGRPARVHLKVDTGLSRGGAALADWPDLVEAARKAEAEGAVGSSALWSHFAYADAPGHPTIAPPGRGVPPTPWSTPRAPARARGPAPRQLGRDADRAGAALRPGAAGHRGLRALAGARGRRPADYGLRPAMTLRRRARPGEAGAGRQRRVLRAHLHDRPRDHARPGAARLRRRCAARRAATSARCSPPAAAARSPAGSAWTSSCSTSATTRRRSATRSCSSAPATTASRPPQDWADATGTISYEIVTRVGPRVPRVYVGRGA